MTKQKIMIVDDDKNICELLRLYLEKEDFSTALAYDGRQAVDSFDDARANRFSTYAARCVENGILSPATFCRKHRPFAPQKHPAGTS